MINFIRSNLPSTIINTTIPEDSTSESTAPTQFISPPTETPITLPPNNTATQSMNLWPQFILICIACSVAGIIIILTIFILVCKARRKKKDLLFESQRPPTIVHVKSTQSLPPGVMNKIVSHQAAYSEGSAHQYNTHSNEVSPEIQRELPLQSNLLLTPYCSVTDEQETNLDDINRRSNSYYSDFKTSLSSARVYSDVFVDLDEEYLNEDLCNRTSLSLQQQTCSQKSVGSDYFGSDDDVVDLYM